jgi:hypothetical protein
MHTLTHHLPGIAIAGLALAIICRKRAPARDWGRIRWFRSEASRRNLERWEP